MCPTLLLLSSGIRLSGLFPFRTNHEIMNLINSLHIKDISVGVAMGYGLDDWGLFQVGARNVSVL
jgi:hypothetical protein